MHTLHTYTFFLQMSKKNKNSKNSASLPLKPFIIVAFVAILIYFVLNWFSLSTKILIVVAKQDPPRGLTLDAELYLNLLRQNSFDARVVHPDSIKAFDCSSTDARYILIHHESVDNRTLEACPSGLETKNVHILVPNIEIPQNLENWKHMSFIFSKTYHAVDSCRQLLSDLGVLSVPVIHVGHTSDDVFGTTSKNESKLVLQARSEESYRKWLHIAGASLMKQTQLLVQAWAEFGKDWPPITLVYTDVERTKVGLPPLNDVYTAVGSPHNVRLIGRHLNRTRLRQLAVEAGVYVYPSAAEGFGHVINRARAAAGVLIVPDCPPMHEFLGPFDAAQQLAGVTINVADKHVAALQSTVGNRTIGVPIAAVSTKDVAAAVESILQLSLEEKQRMSARARTLYETERRQFEENLIRELSQIIDSF